jgi:hypothetical protein
MDRGRRLVLKGLLGGAAVSVALPVLDWLVDDNGAAFAGGSPLPRRFGLFFWGNGVLPARWVPTGTGEGPSWELSEQLAPLLPVKDLVTVVSGMRIHVSNDIAHGSGPAGMLSGAPLLLYGGEAFTFSQPSIDQVLATALGSATRFRSLEVACQPGAAGLSHTGPDNTNPPEPSPHALFSRIFGTGFVEPGDEPILDPRVGLRRSVLDAVLADATRLRARVGAADRARIDQHLSGIRDLEQQLARLEEDPPNLAACVKPAAPEESYPAVDGRPPLSAIHRAMTDILAMALACDQTRVFSTWFTHPVNNVLFPGASAGHHSLTHDEPGDQPQVHAIVQYILGELTYLVQKLESVTEGDGTLLDRCVILATTDCSYGRQHSLDEYPIVLAGGGGGTLRQGLHYRSTSGENTSKVLLTLRRAMGLGLAEFGVGEGRVTDGLGAIEV